MTSIILLSVFLILISIYLIICYVIYRMCFYCKKIKTDKDCFKIPKTPQYEPIYNRMYQYVTELQGKPYEQVFIKNRNNKILAARVYRTTPDAPVDLCFHGWRGNSLRDFCGGARISIEMGHNLVLVDQRGQGQSFGHTMTFGVKEKFDVQDWCIWAESEFSNSEINLFGISMGAASVVMSSGLNLPGTVKHIIADCPYNSPVNIIRKVCDIDMKLSSRFLYPFLLGSALIFGHFKLNDVKSSGNYAVSITKIPILIIHGDEDLFVPCEMSTEIVYANPNLVTKEVFAGAGHGLSYMVDTERYNKIVKEFLEK